MNKTAIVAAGLLAACALPAQADTVLGVYAGVQGWQSDASGGFADENNSADLFFDSETTINGYVAVEHLVPFVPNIKIARANLDHTGSGTLSSSFTFDGDLYSAGSNVGTSAELTSTDFILYYELFDNDLVSFDVGLNGKYIDATFAVNDAASSKQGSVDVSGVIPMVYSRVSVGLPFTGLAAYAEGSYLSLGDHSVSDYQIALTYSFIESLALDMTLQLGYRDMSFDIEDLDDQYADLSFDGVFAGLEVHF